MLCLQSKIQNQLYKKKFVDSNFSSKFEELTHEAPFKFYYKDSIIKTESNTDLYLIFSDDIEWCKKSFLMKNVTFIENEKDYIEIFLQSKCTHNIISNSTDIENQVM